MKQNKLRAIPAVERVLHTLGNSSLPRASIVAVVRRELAALRKEKVIPNFDAVVARIRATLDKLNSSRIQPVINGTGIIVHTNLGRSPLGPAAVDALREIASHYNNLELDLVSGERGARAGYLEDQLAQLCRAESATVVNNCAAALVLILRHFTSGPRKEVIISRGELVQIGGGFRIPEILETSGAVLREIGATNKTSLSDYSRAIGRSTALILKVHRSNFFMGGFVESAKPEEIAALAKRKRIPFVEDLGSGAVVATEKLASLDHEPTPAEALKRGVDLVCFSGDKLFGGPQAGIIAGKARLVSALKKEPFFRALRCDKLIMAALQATAESYLQNRPEEVQALALIEVSLKSLRDRAERIVAALKELPLQAEIGEGKAQIGGGTLPQSVIASVTVDLRPGNIALAEFSRRLRLSSPAIVGYVAGNRFKLDLRTVFPTQDDAIIAAIRSAVAAAQK